MSGLSHNSVEQKFVVKTPSCATNVSDHSSGDILVVSCLTFGLKPEFFRERELFLLLSWAAAPTLTTLSSMQSARWSASSLSCGLLESILPSEDVDDAELRLLSHGASILLKFCSSEIRINA